MTSNEVTLTLEKRTVIGKKVARLRADGQVPGVIYGHSMKATPVQGPLLAVQKAIRLAGKNHPVHLTIDGKKKLALIKDVALDPVHFTIQNVTFHAVKQNETVTAEVPVRLVGAGESPAERAGLVVLQAVTALEVSSRPAAIPEALEVSIENLAEAGQKLTVADITLPEGVELAADPELAIATVYEPGALQRANDSLAGDGEDAADVAAENGEDTPQDTQAAEDQPGGKQQNQPAKD
ncbi:MAG TPA: 50S ribosomal protein L25 [Verrucomicrobiae bacterium]|nr:50S ribosomal protein L25 [Verrucomicrobiae bacterium]